MKWDRNWLLLHAFFSLHRNYDWSDQSNYMSAHVDKCKRIRVNRVNFSSFRSIEFIFSICFILRVTWLTIVHCADIAWLCVVFRNQAGKVFFLVFCAVLRAKERKVHVFAALKNGKQQNCVSFHVNANHRSAQSIKRKRRKNTIK